MPEHVKMRELYNLVSDWDPSKLLFSKNFEWTRWGLLGILADYVLYYTSGNIIEVGVCETSIFFTQLATKHNRKAYHNDLQHSVIENCKTIPEYFGPNSQTYTMPSDQFFATTQFEFPIALIFIDGDHLYEQVKKDFDNALKLLQPDGYIFLHDTLPPDSSWTNEGSCGTVYKLREEIEANPEFDIFTFKKSAWDVGLSMVQKRNNRYTGE